MTNIIYQGQVPSTRHSLHLHLHLQHHLPGVSSTGARNRAPRRLVRLVRPPGDLSSCAMVRLGAGWAPLVVRGDWWRLTAPWSPKSPPARVGEVERVGLR